MAGRIILNKTSIFFFFHSFRSVLADFLNHYMKPFTPISADNVGANSCCIMTIIVAITIILNIL